MIGWEIVGRIGIVTDTSRWRRVAGVRLVCPSRDRADVECMLFDYVLAVHCPHAVVVLRYEGG